MMKKYYTIALLCFVGIATTNAQYTNIPDPNFEQALYDLGYDDIANDGQVLTNNINTLTSLNVDASNISDLTGIADFTALETLSLNDNSVSALDLTGISNLTFVAARNNGLTSLDISTHANMDVLLLENNSLTSLDVSNNVNLTRLWAQNNNINTLNVSNNPLLRAIGISDSNLTSLDLIQNIALEQLYAGGNAITALDLSNNPALRIVGVNGNNLSTLNVKNGNNTNVTTFVADGNPNLTCISVDDATYSTTNWTGIDAQMYFSNHNCRYTAIPDANFETALSAYDDIANDGQIPTDQIKNVSTLDVSNRSISDITGIEAFVSLTSLNASGNSFTTININALTKLVELSLENSKITSLDVSENTVLGLLALEESSLTSVDVSYNLELEALNVLDNGSLTDITFGNNNKLKMLLATGCRLTSVDLSALTALEDVRLKGNDLTSLNLKNGNNTSIVSFSVLFNDNLSCMLVDDAVAFKTTWGTQIEPDTTVSDTYCKYTSIPDSNFEGALEELGYDDIAGDGQVPTKLIERIANLDIRNKSISDFTGMEGFTSLRTLYVSDNSMEKIDLSFNTKLQRVDLISSSLTAIDLSKNTLLETVALFDTKNSSLDLSLNTNLKILRMYRSSIRTLDLSNNSKLESIRLEDNTALEKITLSAISPLRSISARNSKLTSLDVSEFSSLKTLLVNNNNLTALNVKNGNNHDMYLKATGNPDLTCVIVDDPTVDQVLWGSSFDDHTSLSDTYCHYTAILDINFEKALEDLGYDDISEDGQVPTTLIEEISVLEIDNNGITDLTGIEDFKALTTLNVSNNVLSSLAVNSNVYLEYLVANNNDLTSVDIAQNVSLKSIGLRDNLLTTIDLSKNILLDDIEIDSNNLEGLDVSTNTLLTQIAADHNAITDLDISNNNQLLNLSITNNGLETLIVGTNTILSDLEVNDNALVSLNLDGASALDLIDVFNNKLEYFSCKNANNTSISVFRATGNTDLTCILVDDAAYSTTNWTNIDTITNFSDTYCRYTSIPDSNFETVLGNLGYDDISADGQVPTTLIEVVTFLDVGFNDISDATGIEDFTAIETLVFNTNKLTSLNLSSNAELERLNCSNNELSSLVISGNKQLKELSCSSNNLNTLDLTDNTTLKELYASNLNLTNLDVSMLAALEVLDISDNAFSNIDVSKNESLNFLSLNNTSIAQLELSNNTLIERLKMSESSITSLDLSALSNLVLLSINDNQDLSFVNLQNGNNANVLFFSATGNLNSPCILVDDVTYSTTNWIGIDDQTSFSDTYCRYTAIPDINFEAVLESKGYDDISGDGQVPTALIESITSLNLINRGISDVTGIEDFKTLETLKLTSDKLTSIDLTQNIYLKGLNLSDNDLSTIDLTNNIHLEDLNLSRNKLTAINLSKNIALKEIDISSNNLSVIDLSSLQVLEDLDVSYNELTSLDVSANTLLDDIVASETALSSIDLSKNTLLTNLEIQNSATIESINVSGLTLLEHLYLNGSNVKALDTSDNTALSYIGIDDNTAITSLDISNNPSISSLEFDNCTALTTITFGDNPSLFTIKAVNTGLTSIDVSSLVNLSKLKLSEAKIKVLDLSSNLNLEELDVTNGELAQLNIKNSANGNITVFDITGNPNLSCVLVDDMAYSTANWTAIDAQTSFNETSCITNLPIALKVFLQGAAINPNTGEENLMRDDLRVAGIIPTTSPYTDGLICEATVFDTTGDDAIVDWVWVELRDQNDASAVVAGQSALLQRDGDIVAVDGVSDFGFSVDEDNYYVLVTHRNHLGVLSANAIGLSTTVASLDFTNDTSLIQGGANAVIDIGGTYTMLTGDQDGNGQVQNTDINTVITTLGGSGYSNADMDMNGQIQNTDINNLMNPNVGKGEQF